MLRMTMIVSAGLLLATSAIAQEEEQKGPWSGTTSLGYLATTGNTENKSYNAAAEISYARKSQR